MISVTGMDIKNILKALYALKNIVFVETEPQSEKKYLDSEKNHSTPKPQPPHSPLSKMDVPLSDNWNMNQMNKMSKSYYTKHHNLQLL